MSSDEITSSSDALLRFFPLIALFLVLVLVLRDLLCAGLRPNPVLWDWTGLSLPQDHDVPRLVIERHEIAPYLLAFLIFDCV